MFYYFGRKGRLAPHYPRPLFPTIIEPFAGSMAYSMYHQPSLAIGFEIDPVVVKVWRRIVKLRPDQLLAYAEPDLGQRITDRWQMMAAGSHGTSAANSYLWTDRMARDFSKQKRLAARLQPYAFDHVWYEEGNYWQAPDIPATWFIDPPYQHVHRGYDRSSADYDKLAEWCRTRSGQVIVCEQEGADWLPFRPLTEIRGTTNRRSTEMIWTSE